jgi:hypothetical protein
VTRIDLIEEIVRALDAGDEFDEVPTRVLRDMAEEVLNIPFIADALKDKG